MSPRRLSVLAAIVIAIGGAVVVANPSSFGLGSIAQAPAARPSPDKSEWLKDLNLSTDQLQKIQAIRSQYKDKISQNRRTLRQSQQELRNLIGSEASTDQVREKYTQVKAIKQQLADAQFESMLATREVLNPAQRRQFVDHMLKAHENFRDRMQNRH